MIGVYPEPAGAKTGNKQRSYLMLNITKFTKSAVGVALVAAPLLVAAPAMAQEAGKPDIYVGGEVGYHDLGSNPVGASDGVVYGFYAGVDVPVGPVLVVGAEANFNLGSNAIDTEYGVAGKIGANVTDRAQLFVRGGYQEVNYDLNQVSGGTLADGPNDTDGDYLVGVGAQYKIAPNVSVRATLDTIGFDTTRALGGIAMHF